ncbi:hypothetical protein LPJ61_005688 [Coemansia biformis]|uniref:Uncharacterized protein n=1 Tax=Coemansia biformis TaxID=1286918 RepID=A0A9W8CVJ3_9FUNG|nr:hypothetical protein LPJ61_005688 [Coemansia biformis]
MAVLRYGYLRGTFGLPYGGYTIQEPHPIDVELDAANEHRQMFCVLGRFSAVTGWLDGNQHTITARQAAQATFTREIVAEVYTESSWIAQMLWGLGCLDVQLVIRIGRTWDRRPRDRSCQFFPVLKVIAPSEVVMDDIGALLRRAVPGQVLDAAREKDLVARTLSRAPSHGLPPYRRGSMSLPSPSPRPPPEYE